MLNLTDHAKERLEDKLITGDVLSESFAQRELIRVHAVKVTFTDTSFKQSVLSACYFRNCTFIRCDFTGAQIKETNFRGAKFQDCKFLYTSWEKSQVEEKILESCLPAEENLARDLVRSLRVNFSQIGNYEAVNRAALIEVELTGRHLYNAAYSRQSYYRQKYKEWDRIWNGLGHARWKFLDVLWGNGESLWKIVRSSAFVILCAAAFNWNPKTEFIGAIKESFLQFWGVGVTVMPENIAAFLVITRFVFFGLFMAILIKRLSQR